MSLAFSETLSLLQKMAPLELAESWDNVGLLLPPPDEAPVARIFLTIDLTEAVLEEAVQSGAKLVVAYHPPWFGGLKRLDLRIASSRVLYRAIRTGLAIYSPHTALDAAADGMTDFLADCLGPGDKRPIMAKSEVDPRVGVGRHLTLGTPLSLEAAAERLRDKLGLRYVRVAPAAATAQALSGAANPGASIRRAALVPGAGGSVLAELTEVDLLVTGEMRHHDVLSAVARGIHVVLAEHTGSERAFLPLFGQRLARESGAEVLVSALDQDPLALL